jgi:tryptophan halogenase
MKKRKFAVVGGGTAGWIAAHAVRKYFPDDDISIVYSEARGTIGVGEATTPHMVEFLNSIGIDLRHFLKNVGGTIKHGISFENWNGDGTRYMHPFVEKLTEFSMTGVFSHDCWDLYNKLLINQNLPVEQHLYQTNLAYKNKVDINNTSFAIHFDNHKFAEYLKWFASVKNIKRGGNSTIRRKKNMETLIFKTVRDLKSRFGRATKIEFVKEGDFIEAMNYFDDTYNVFEKTEENEGFDPSIDEKGYSYS